MATQNTNTSAATVQTRAPAVQGRSTALNITLIIAALLIFITLVSLGNWQMDRLEWKETLIDTVNARAFGEPVAPPVGSFVGKDHAYLRVVVEGTFDYKKTHGIKALTEFGAGYWLATPLHTANYTVWINRGFVPSTIAAENWPQPEGVQRIEGLLRSSQPGGTRLEKNNAEQGRWFSFDVAALSANSKLENAAAFYIDADRASGPGEWPRGGMTVIDFRNSHLVYAATWYTMAALLLVAVGYAIRDVVRNAGRSNAAQRSG